MQDEIIRQSLADSALYTEARARADRARLALYEGLPWDEIVQCVEYVTELGERYKMQTETAGMRALLARIQEARRE